MLDARLDFCLNFYGPLAGLKQWWHERKLFKRADKHPELLLARAAQLEIEADKAGSYLESKAQRDMAQKCRAKWHSMTHDAAVFYAARRPNQNVPKYGPERWSAFPIWAHQQLQPGEELVVITVVKVQCTEPGST